MGCCDCLIRFLHCSFKTMIMSAIIAGIVFIIMYHDKLLSWLYFLDNYIHTHPKKGPLIIVGIYVVLEIFFVPGAILAIATGYTLKRAYEDTN